jgi:hypothetical protein
MHEHEDGKKKVCIDVCSTCFFTFLYHNNYLLIKYKNLSMLSHVHYGKDFNEILRAP